MDALFEEMLGRLKLTSKQRADAKTKYTNVSKLLHDAFYSTVYTGSTKLLIGSYGKRTNIRPPQDIDLLFKIPLEAYEQYKENPSGLLQRIRGLLSERYSTTDKVSAWGKVVLVEFADGKHDIELLPAYDVGDVFLIPNSENGGSWESFDARSDMRLVQESNSTNGGITRKLIKIVKRWRVHTKTVSLKSYELERLCVSFLGSYNYENKQWSRILEDFFVWLALNTEKDASQIQTAITRSNRANALITEEKFVDACKELQKIFGDRTFPSYSSGTIKAHNYTINEPSPNEQFIEDIFPVRIDPAYSLAVRSTITGKGFREHSIEEFLRKFIHLPKNMSVSFAARSNISVPVRYFWKVRNFGEAAKRLGQLRGEIRESSSSSKHSENTLYKGLHYVECYAVINGICVAKAMRFIPIGDE